jgi:hypothetical protein
MSFTRIININTNKTLVRYCTKLDKKPKTFPLDDWDAVISREIELRMKLLGAKDIYDDKRLGQQVIKLTDLHTRVYEVDHNLEKLRSGNYSKPVLPEEIEEERKAGRITGVCLGTAFGLVMFNLTSELPWFLSIFPFAWAASEIAVINANKKDDSVPRKLRWSLEESKSILQEFDFGSDKQWMKEHLDKAEKEHEMWLNVRKLQ